MLRPKAAILLLLLLLGMNSTTAGAVGMYEWWSSLWLPGVSGPTGLPGAGFILFPSLESPLGGRYEGMGTAAVALAGDAGFLEANPAVAARLASTEFTLSHHGWIADSNIEGLLYAIRFGELGFAFSGKFLYLPFTAYNAWGERSATGTISETVASAAAAYNLFPNYYFDGLAAGASLKLAYRGVPPAVAPGQSLFGLMADVGVQTSFNLLKFFSSRTRNFSLGVALRNLGLATSLGGTAVGTGEELPLTFSAGIAYAPVRPITVATDLNVPLSLDPATPARLPDVAIGTDVVFTDFLSVQAGMHLKPGNPRISLGTNVALKGVSITANYNLDLSSTFSDPVDKFSVQARFDLGDRGRGALKAEVERLYRAGLEEYLKSNLESAIALWQRVLQLDPGHIPAQQIMATAQQTLENQVRAQQRPGQ